MAQGKGRRVSSEKRWGKGRIKRELRNYKIRERKRGGKQKKKKKKTNFQVKTKIFHIFLCGKQI